tara:strand:- start:175 stop:732 length:558 start_codon:yes stop_codon:yes gene_type:complete
MKDRFDAVNEVYYPYVKKHLGNNPLQNILTCGGSEGAINVELDRHKDLNYKGIFHYELLLINHKAHIHQDEKYNVIRENILYPIKSKKSVNLIYADVGGGDEIYEKMKEDNIKEGMIKILDNGFIDNELGILVFLFFDGVGIEPFLDKKYDNYNSKDFFSTNITWHDEYNKGTYNQRLDGVFFYK